MTNQFRDATKKVSPAAQLVWDAFCEAPICAEVKLASALRAVADQVVPFPGRYPTNEYMEGIRDTKQDLREQLLAIADELEAQQ